MEEYPATELTQNDRPIKLTEGERLYYESTTIESPLDVHTASK